MKKTRREVLGISAAVLGSAALGCASRPQRSQAACGCAGQPAYRMLEAFVQQLGVRGRRRVTLSIPADPRLTDDEALILDAFGCAQAEDYRSLDERLHGLLDASPPFAMGAAACIVPAGEGRMIFALPWYGRTLVGTTDNDFDGDITHPRPGSQDVEYLLEAVNDFFGVSHTDSDLVGAYAGVRPLISSGDPRKSVDISRKAELYETSSGMLTITGGKLTTWRRMAKSESPGRYL